MEPYTAVTVRVINTADTREFANCALNDFEKPSDLDELREDLFSRFGEKLAVEHANEMEIVWIGPRNTKVPLKCDENLQKALNYFEHNPNKNTLFVAKLTQKVGKSMKFLW